MKNPYRVMKFIVCDLSEQECGDAWPYKEYMPKPKCKDCDFFIEALQKSKREKEAK